MRWVIVGSVMIAAGSLPISAEGQYLETRSVVWSRHSWQTSTPKYVSALPTQPAQPGDNRTQYAIVGAVFLGAVGGWALHEACKTQPVPIEPAQNRSCTGSTVGGAAVGAALGGGLGYVVGRLTHKR